MANQYTSATLPGTYADDFDPTNNYHQILFNSGRALQARELTQLQSIIFAEMSRMGGNLYKEGAAISGAGTSINSAYDYVKIASTNAGGEFSAIPVGTIFSDPITNIKAQVLEVSQAKTGQLFDTLFIEYINNGSAVSGNTPTRFGDQVTLFDQSGGGYELITETPNATGKGVKFTVAEGEFFALGRFVNTIEQSIILSPYENSAIDTVVGFRVVQDIVTVNDTEALYDNTNGVVNTASPGADRYRISLVLTTEDQVTDSQTFLFLARVENSKISEEIQIQDSFNKINDLLSIRTKEESGDYVVNPFTVNVDDFDNGLDSNLDLIVSEGTAYINGYRVENQSSAKFKLPRPTATELVNNDTIGIQLGNYFLCNVNKDIPILDYTEVNLYSAVTAGGSVVGTARVRGIQHFSDTVQKVFVYDVTMQPGQSIAQIRSLGTASTNYFDIVVATNGIKLYETDNNDLLFATNNARPSDFDDITVTVQKYQTKTAVGNAVTLDQLPVGQSYTQSSEWILSTAQTSGVELPSTYVVTITNSGRDASVTSLAQATDDYKIIAFVQKTATIKPKTATTSGTTSFTSSVDAVSGVTYFNLGLPDIYSVDSVRQNNSAGNDLSSIFTIDDGQRDNYYGDGRLVLKDGFADPGTIYVNFKSFTRGAGDFYAVNSYNVPYSDIPKHITNTGEEISLHDVIDFRPDQNTAGTVSNIPALPLNGSLITADVNYYLPRADKVIMTHDGEINILMGQQARDPQFKETPDNSMELYKIILNANTKDENDLVVVPTAQQRGYTMKDIGDLENKIDAIEESTSLSIFELEARLDNVLDSDGVIRIISGLQVNEATDHTGTDTGSPDHRASIDPENRLIRPSFEEGNTRLVYVPNNTADAFTTSHSSTGVVKKGDNIYLAHDSAEWTFQKLASRTTKINPFGLIDNVGTLKLSPSTDEWKESIQDAVKVLAGTNKLSAKQAHCWNNWQWNWGGRTNGSNFTANVRRVVASESLRRVIGDRTVDLALVPWIRSRKIFFKAQGLTPNTKFTPFFDGKDVSAWCREEVAFVQWSDRVDDIGNKNTYSTMSGHPDGTTDLIADANGEVIGSFFIPNITPKYALQHTKYRGRYNRYYLRFRAGAREFKLLDINVNDWASANSKAFTHYTAKGLLPWVWWNPLTRSRGNKYLYPYNYTRKLYSAKELKRVLDRVPAASVKLIDPQLSGLYGPDGVALDGAALQTLANNTQMSKVLSDYININFNQFADILPATVQAATMNPLAQTFHVSNDVGVTLTKIDLFFKSKPTTTGLPVSVHIRPVENGKPSTSDIIPDSHVYVNSADVVATSNTNQLVTIQGAPTPFVFEEPLYLSPGQDYAIVVTSQSTEYELYTAKTREPVINSKARSITTQSAPGAMFLPQNGVNWTDSKDQDLMFKLTRAKFGTNGGANGSLVLKNADVPARLLSENPLQTTISDHKIYVRHANHGLQPGDGARLDSCAEIGGFSSAQLSGSFEVIDVDAYGYRFEIDPSNRVTATTTEVGGGEKCLSLGNTNFSVANPHIESIIPNTTSIDVSAQFTSGKSVSGSETRFVRDTKYTRITPKTNTDFEKVNTLYNSYSQDSDIGAGIASAYFKVDMKSASDFVSPIIDLQRSSLITVNNLIDDPSVTPHIYPVAETSATGSTTVASHINSPVVLQETAVGIQIKTDASVHSECNFRLAYRVCSSDQDIQNTPWVVQNPTDAIVKDGSVRSVEFLVGDKNGTIPPFSQVQTKFILESKNSGKPVTIGNSVVKYLAV
mgnify:CR=1 FL=1|tara:strand:- start:5960 stop:11266 length:5307 start_codon:yes stop_codon:yes gene_type:complete